MANIKIPKGTTLSIKGQDFVLDSDAHIAVVGEVGNVLAEQLYIAGLLSENDNLRHIEKREDGEFEVSFHAGGKRQETLIEQTEVTKKKPK